MADPSKSFILFLLLTSICSPALVYIPGLNLQNPMNLYMLQVACNILESDLNLNPALPQSSAYTYYADTYMVNYFLNMVSNDPGIASYNNVIVGGMNTINSGTKNLIFGNNNTVTGSNNYVFSSNFNATALNLGTMSNDLILDNWLIQLLKMYLIPFGPSQAINRWS